MYMCLNLNVRCFVSIADLFPKVPGKFQLKGHERLQSLSSLNVGRENQFFPGQRRDVTYVSRLQVHSIIIHI